MAKLGLIQALRSDVKKGHLFESDSQFVSYKTGFPGLDYAMGFNINVFNENNELIDTYPSIGATGGTIIGIVGKTHVGKTTLAIQIAANIVRPFDNGAVVHHDIEGGTNMTRISMLTKFTMSEIDDGKYVLNQNDNSIEEIKEGLYELYNEKVSNPEIYKYNTGKKNEFGRDIITYVPTVAIIDSVAMLTSKVNENTKDGVEKLSTVSTQTDRMRLTGEIGRFLQESMGMLRRANIILILINHVKEKPPMGTPQAPEMRYLKQNETMPAGKTLQYLTDTLIYVTSKGSEKYAWETDGFEGFGVGAKFVKNRSNADGVEVPLVFNKKMGYDSLRSSISYAKSLELLGGNRAGYYFGDRKDKKFKAVSTPEDFYNDRELYKIMYEHILPPLREKLRTLTPDEILFAEEEMDY